MASLQALQQDYVQRDPSRTDSFISRLFPNDADVLLLGTEGGTFEWVRGYAAAAAFIKTDGQGWGDFGFDVDRSLVWSSGDVAWVASIGSIRFKNGERPVRFTAILTRDQDHWAFCQLHLQWDDDDPHETELLSPRTYFRIARNAFR